MNSEKQVIRESIVSLILAASNDTSWHNYTVLNNELIDNREFYRASYSAEILPIDTSKIVGTQHGSYNQGCTWIDVLEYLKRLGDHRGKSLEEIKDVVLDENIGEKKAVCKYDDKYYIIAGNHRLCIAKFLGIIDLPCEVVICEFQQTDFEAYQQLLSHGFTISEYKLGCFDLVRYQSLIFHSLNLSQVQLLLNAFELCKYTHAQIYLAEFKRKFKEWLYSPTNQWKYVDVPNLDKPA